MDKNVIFLEPLSPFLDDLRIKLEQEDDVIIFDVDSLDEYRQTVHILEKSVTFSSDFKQTQSYLEEFKGTLDKADLKNYIVTDRDFPPHVVLKMRKLGLNDVLLEESGHEEIIHKLNSFFEGFDTDLEKEIGSKEKSSFDFEYKSTGQSQVIGDSSKQKLRKGKSFIEFKPISPFQNLKKFNTSFNSKKPGAKALLLFSDRPAEFNSSLQKKNESPPDRPKLNGKLVDFNKPMDTRKGLTANESPSLQSLFSKKFVPFNREVLSKKPKLIDFSQGTSWSNKRLIEFQGSGLVRKKDQNTEQKEKASAEDNLLILSNIRSQFIKDKAPPEYTKDILKKSPKKVIPLTEEEVLFFEGNCFGIEYLAYFNEIFLHKETKPKVIFKFLDMLIYKQWNGSVIFCVKKGESLIDIYSSTQDSEDFLSFREKISFPDSELLTISVPKWEDETFRIKTNRFYYPYFIDNDLKGVAIVFTNSDDFDHQRSKAVESFVMLARSLYYNTDDLL